MKDRTLCFTIWPALSVYLADDESYCLFLGQTMFNLASKSHWSQWWDLTYMILRHMHIQDVCICMLLHTVCTVYVHVGVLVYACHHQRVFGCDRNTSCSSLHVDKTVQSAVSPDHRSTMTSPLLHQVSHLQGGGIKEKEQKQIRASD